MNRVLLKSCFVCFLLVIVTFWSSCRKDFDDLPSSGRLEFSKDTVFLDTIFTNIGSATYTLKVYNRSGSDVNIPFVGLETGASSSYRLNVDGQAGKTFNNIPLLAKDSLFVFIETTFDISQTPENEFLHTESLLFGIGEEQQKVELVTLVKDAVFLYPATLSNGTIEKIPFGLDENGNEIKVEGFFLDPDELHFTNEKPYVIYGYAAVPEGNTLIIDVGARVHFHNNSGLLVGSGASLQINGLLSEDQELLENEVIFEGDRLEPEYANVSGQWGTVWLQAGSINNQINHLTLKNATIGLQVDGDGLLSDPTLILRNTQIYNSLEHNLWGRASHIVAENSVLANAGAASFIGSNGGIYQFMHCTSVNYQSNNIRTWPTLALDNFSASNTIPQQIEFTNCIIDGNMRVEISLQSDSNTPLDFKFENCLIKFNDSANEFEDNPQYDFSNTENYQNIILNGNADFIDPFKDQFQIGENSEAIDTANPNVNPPILLDILGNTRDSNPDIGAYENKSNN